MSHGHRPIVHRTRSGSASTRRHTGDHGTLGDLWARDSRMHTLHHTWARLTLHMSSARVLHTHGMTMRHTWVARSYTRMGGKRLGHHLQWCLVSNLNRARRDEIIGPEQARGFH